MNFNWLEAINLDWVSYGWKENCNIYKFDPVGFKYERINDFGSGILMHDKNVPEYLRLPFGNNLATEVGLWWSITMWLEFLWGSPLWKCQNASTKLHDIEQGCVLLLFSSA